MKLRWIAFMSDEIKLIVNKKFSDVDDPTKSVTLERNEFNFNAPEAINSRFDLKYDLWLAYDFSNK